jgi:hypothetical protein
MANGNVEIQFGAGISDVDDELLIPNPDLVGGALPMTNPNLSINIDPSNFLYTKSYGIAPSNTTLTVRYTVGGGTADNVESDILTKIVSKNILVDETGLDSVLYNQVLNSLAVTNPQPASGGKVSDNIEEVRPWCFEKASSNSLHLISILSLSDFIINSANAFLVSYSFKKAFFINGIIIINFLSFYSLLLFC